MRGSRAGDDAGVGDGERDEGAGGDGAAGVFGGVEWGGGGAGVGGRGGGLSQCRDEGWGLDLMVGAWRKCREVRVALCQGSILSRKIIGRPECCCLDASSNLPSILRIMCLELCNDLLGFFKPLGQRLEAVRRHEADHAAPRLDKLVCRHGFLLGARRLVGAAMPLSMP